MPNLELKLGSFAEVSSFFAEQIALVYPEVLQQKDSIKKILVQEEERFASHFEKWHENFKPASRKIPKGKAKTN